jgi:hypothetical protein
MDVDGEEEETRKLREVAMKTTRRPEEEAQGGGDTGSEGKGSNRVGGFLVRAMQGFEKIREKVRGKSLFRNMDTGEIRIVGDNGEKKREGEEEVNVEELTEIGEELTEIGEELDIEVELREVKGKEGSERGVRGPMGQVVWMGTRSLNY